MIVKKISAVINVVEAELTLLPQAVKSVEKLADEIVIVDMSTSGLPQSLKKKSNLKVYLHKFVKWVEPARNFGISKAEGDWILILDPDEELSPHLVKKLKKIVQENKGDYVAIPRKNIVFGKWLEHSRWWPDYNVRFFKKGKVIWNEEIHAPPLTQGRGLDLEAKPKNAIKHHHYVSIDQYLERMARYTSVQAQEKIKAGYKFVWQDLIRKPMAEFLSRYFAGQGYKDGLHGLALSLLQAFSELVLCLKIWDQKEKELQIEKVIQEMRANGKDLHFWQADARGGLINQIKKKFKLP